MTRYRPTTRSIAAVAVVVLVAAAIAGAVIGAPGRSPTEQAVATDEITITGPEVIPAGEPATLRIDQSIDPDATVVALVVTTAGAIEREVTMNAGRGEILLDETVTRVAGSMTVIVLVDGFEARATLVVVAGPTARPTTPLVGAKSIVADGSDSAMAVGLPSDRYGNHPVDAAELETAVRRIDGSLEQGSSQTTGLVQWTRILAGVDAGRAEVSMRVGDVQGPTAELDEVPGIPQPFALVAEPAPLRADGRTLHVLDTDQLIDANGNVLLDGTSVLLVAETAEGIRQLSSITIDGRAQFVLESPASPGTVQLRAGTAGVWSEDLGLDFAPAIDDVPARLVRDSQGLTLEIGPVVMVDGGLVPDGTTVVFRDRDQTHEAVLELGRARIAIVTEPGSGATVEVLGIAVEVPA